MFLISERGFHISPYLYQTTLRFQVIGFANNIFFYQSVLYTTRLLYCTIVGIIKSLKNKYQIRIIASRYCYKNTSITLVVNTTSYIVRVSLCVSHDVNKGYMYLKDEILDHFTKGEIKIPLVYSISLGLGFKLVFITLLLCYRLRMCGDRYIKCK